MWDNDSGNDDLMSKWTGSVDSFSEQKELFGHYWGKGKQNSVRIRTDWIPSRNQNNYNSNYNNKNYNRNFG